MKASRLVAGSRSRLKGVDIDGCGAKDGDGSEILQSRAEIKLTDRDAAMLEYNSITATQIAAGALKFQKRLTGYTPTSVNIVLSDDILVVIYHGALTPAELMLAKDPDGATRLRALHAELFANSNEGFRREIQRITGRQARAAAMEIDTTTGAAVHVFATNAQVHLCVQRGEAAVRNGLNHEDGTPLDGPRKDGLGTPSDLAEPI